MNPRKPTSLKLIEGTFRKDRATLGEPRPEVVIPEIPAHLTDEARAEWERLAPELCKLGLLTRLDRGALAVYCQCYARWVKAELEIAKSSEVSEAPSSYLMKNPWVNISKESLELMHKYMRGFGMDPESRTRIHAQPKEKEDDFESFARSRPKKN